MSCQRCGFYFCWCCMGSLDNHQRWYMLCPELPFSLCGNLLVTFLFIVFLPAIIVIGPAIAIIFYTGIYYPYRALKYGGGNRCCRFTLFLLCFLILMPICLALGMLAVLVANVFALIPLYYYSIHFFVRLSIAGCRTKL